MKRVIYIGFMVLLFQPFAYADNAQAPATQTPTTQQTIGQTKATIARAYFPTFEKFQNSTNSTCQTYLEKTLSGAPINTISPYGNGTSVGTFSDSFALIDGLQLSYAIPAAYRTSAKLLVTWTVRIEGEVIKQDISPELCTNWSGTLVENFKSSLVHTKLYVNGEAKGTQVTMEIPETTETVTEAPKSDGATGFRRKSSVFRGRPLSHRDPTLVGTYVLTAQDFGGTFPETLNLEIRWINKTGMTLISPEGMRSIIVNFLPTTKNE